MIAVYQATFFLSIALLAIVITVFVLAVSLLGRAVRISIEEQVQSEQDGLKRSQSEIANLTEQFKRAGGKNEQPNMDRIQKSINKIKWRQRFLKLKLRWISIKPKFLGVPLGVIFPGLLFLIAFFSSTFAIYFESSSHSMALSLWYTSLITILIGTINLFLTLRVTQSVAITSEETSYLRQKEMMVSALLDVEERKRPSFTLGFRESMPINIKSDEVLAINVYIHLTSGTIARKARAMVFLPKGFEAIGHTIFRQPDHLDMFGGLDSFQITFNDCTRAFDPSETINIKAPSEKRAYEILYKLGSEEFDGQIEKFTVNVI